MLLSTRAQNCPTSEHRDLTHPGFVLVIPRPHAEADRRKEAAIPDSVRHRPKSRNALDQVRDAAAEGLRFSWLLFGRRST
jgi:hypothetical protein